MGFIATLLILELVGFGNRADPITSGMLALLVFAPLGAIAGLVLGTTLAMRLRGGESTGSTSPQQPEGIAVDRRTLRRGRHRLLCLCRHDRHALAQSERRQPRFSSLRSASPPERHCRILPVTSRSNCRPTSTRMPGEAALQPVPPRRRQAGHRRRRRTRLSHRASAVGDQDQGPARPALPHRPVSQGAAYLRAWTMAAKCRRQRNSLSRQMAGTGLSHACPGSSAGFQA